MDRKAGGSNMKIRRPKQRIRDQPYLPKDFELWKGNDALKDHIMNIVLKEGIY